MILRLTLEVALELDRVLSDGELRRLQLERLELDLNLEADDPRDAPVAVRAAMIAKRITHTRTV